MLKRKQSHENGGGGASSSSGSCCCSYCCGLGCFGHSQQLRKQRVAHGGEGAALFEFAPDLRHQILAIVARRLPQPQQPADFVMMQQAVGAGLNPQRPRRVRTEEILFNAVELRRAAAFENESLQTHSPKTLYQHPH